ncbi:MAG: hypothetical protein HF962_01480 [Sulfurovum sp.]|nr:hypothetical protein [Sulfurovum sp.]
MQTLTIEVKDDFMTEFMKMIDTVKDNVIVKKDKNLELDQYFYERQKDLQKTMDDIESGEMLTYDFETSMDELIKELES